MKTKFRFNLGFGYLVLLSALLLGLGWVGNGEGVRSSRAQASTPDWIFGGSTPRSFADLARGVQDAVVNISTTKNFRIRRGPIYQFHPDYYEQYLKQQGQELKRPNSLGSGFILDRQGYILTNNHVIQGADAIEVRLADGRVFPARAIGSDPKSDLAIVKIDTDEPLPTVNLGDSDALQVGDWVMAIGNPFGLTQTVTAGILSAKGRVIGAGPYDNFLQTDASINPGNSGGPLFNLQGQVVGVNTAIIAGGQGIGFAIPINQAKSIIPQLISSGRVERGYLGLGLQEVTADLAKKLGLSRPQGALVAQVYENSPAQRAGLQPGDLIVKFNDKEISRSQDLPVLVSQTPVGVKATLAFYREGRLQETQVILISLDAPQTQGAPSGGVFQSLLGLAIADLDPVQGKKYRLAPGLGVLVTQVAPDSPAASVGLKAGDLILEFNDRAVLGSKDFIAITQKLNKGDIVRLFVRRGPLSSYFAFAL